MADSDKSFGQTVHQEPADEFHGTDGDVFCAVVFSVFGRKGHHAVFEGFDARICNRHPMSIACQIFKNIFGPFDWIADTDNPFFSKKRVFEILIGVSVKLKFVTLTDLAHIIDELAAEDQR